MAEHQASQIAAWVIAPQATEDQPDHGRPWKYHVNNGSSLPVYNLSVQAMLSEETRAPVTFFPELPPTPEAPLTALLPDTLSALARRASPEAGPMLPMVLEFEDALGRRWRRTAGRLEGPLRGKARPAPLNESSAWAGDQR